MHVVHGYFGLDTVKALGIWSLLDFPNFEIVYQCFKELNVFGCHTIRLHGFLLNSTDMAENVF